MQGPAFGRARASSILIKTMKSLGYSDALARQAVWSALWLEDHQFRGVTTLIVYLCLVRDRTHDTLHPRRHHKFGLVGSCPFILTDSIQQLHPKWGPRGGIACGAPMFPILMVPGLVDWFAAQNKAVRINYEGNLCIASPQGLEFEEHVSGAFHIGNLGHETPVLVELSDEPPNAEQVTYRPVTQISLPEKRLRGRSALFLGDPPKDAP